MTERENRRYPFGDHRACTVAVVALAVVAMGMAIVAGALALTLSNTRAEVARLQAVLLGPQAEYTRAAAPPVPERYRDGTCWFTPRCVAAKRPEGRWVRGASLVDP